MATRYIFWKNNVRSYGRLIMNRYIVPGKTEGWRKNVISIESLR